MIDEEEQDFLYYADMRTLSAKRAKQQGEHFTSLEELQQKYASLETQNEEKNRAFV